MSYPSVLITGGSGSFGHAIVARLLTGVRVFPWYLREADVTQTLAPASRIIVYSRDELKQSEMRKEFGDDPRLRFFIGDVRDAKRLALAMSGVDYVIHAAALKQVPAAEYNPTEFVRTNVYGTENVIAACIAAGVRRAVLLSTDKACTPSTLYGSTKLTAERLFVAANSLSHGTRFACTRYGNVAGSRGSVLNVWHDAVVAGNPLPITDPEMTRFHMTQEQAVDLVLLALSEMDGGEVFIPKLPSYRIGDLARSLYGSGYLQEITGARPGEKKHESLIGPDESRFARDHGTHYRIMPAIHPWRDELVLGGEPVPEGFEYRSDMAPMNEADLTKVAA